MKQLKIKSAASALPVNVQNAYERVLLCWNLQGSVYPVNDTVKEVGVDLLGEGISGIYCPLFGHRLHHRLSHQNDPPMAQPTHQPVRAHTQ